MSNLQRQKKVRGAERAATTRLLDKSDREQCAVKAQWE